MKKTISMIKHICERYKQHHNELLRNEFLSEALEIIEKPASPVGHFTIIAVTLIVVLTFIWASVGKMDQIAAARGKVSTVGGLQLIQPVKGGMVREICVKEGDVVKAGQAIMKLDSSIEDINIKNLRESMDLLKFEKKR